VVRVIGSQPDQAVTGGPVGLAFSPLPALDDYVSAAGAPPGRPALRSLSWPGWPGWPGWQNPAWVALWVLGLAGIVVFERWEAVPFHLIWVGFALLYSFRVRSTKPTLWVIAAMVATTSAAIAFDVSRGTQPADALTEVPLMAAMLGVMMWHSHRRLAASAEYVQVSEENERLLATQRRFLQDASHQLRTPITIALGHSELLARSLAGGRDKRDVNVIVGELNRLRALSDRLLLIAAAENPEFLQPEPVALDELATDIIRRWRPAADRDWQLGRLDAVTVHADRERLSQAIDALLENAVQYTGAGGLVRLSARGGADRPVAELTVEDGGTGIAPAELEGIFDRFASGAGKPGRRGTGLGLSLVRAVAAGHGGEVRVASTPGAGSRFELLLPLSGPAAASPGPADTARAGAAAGKVDAGSTDGGWPRAD
jgi:two-component system, OmpR family, sensor kinase